MRVAFKIQHGVDDVLEHARAGDRTLLGDVPDQDDGDRALLGEPGELRRAFAHLRHASGRRFQRFGVHGLDRIDDDHLGLSRPYRADDRFELDLREKLDRCIDQSEPLRAHRDLFGRFFAGDVQGAPRRADRGHCLQQQRRLSDPGIAAEQDHRAGDQATAENAVEFLEAGRRARLRARLDARERPDVGHRAGDGPESRGHGHRNGFDQGVPGAAMRALPLPLAAASAALGAGVGGSWLGHELVKG